jgi:hypothetical protein
MFGLGQVSTGGGKGHYGCYEQRNACLYHSAERSMSASDGRPVRAMAISNSCRRIVTTRSTPAAPATPNP